MVTEDLTGVGIFPATAAKSIRGEEFAAAGIPIPAGAELLWQAVLQWQSRGFVPQLLLLILLQANGW